MVFKCFVSCLLILCGFCVCVFFGGFVFPFVVPFVSCVVFPFAFVFVFVFDLFFFLGRCLFLRLLFQRLETNFQFALRN